MNRRELLFCGAFARLCAASAPGSELSAAGYIFQQYAEKRKQPLRAVLDEVLTMAKASGFRNLELSSEFFAPDTREKTLSLLGSKGLRTPSLYVGGPLHEEGKAEETIQRVLEVATLGVPFGCKAIVNNPHPKPDNVPKTDAELEVQARSLNRLGRSLSQRGFQLRVHHHTPELADNAREWRHILNHTDGQFVSICIDVDWAYESGFDPVSLMKEAGGRLRELHVRSAKDKVWREEVEDSDIDYSKVADYLRSQQLAPLIVVELAYRPNTLITRPLQEDLQRSRLYTQKVFKVGANE